VDLGKFQDLKKGSCVSSGRSLPVGCSRSLVAEYTVPDWLSTSAKLLYSRYEIFEIGKAGHQTVILSTKFPDGETRLEVSNIPKIRKGFFWSARLRQCSGDMRCTSKNSNIDSLERFRCCRCGFAPSMTEFSPFVLQGNHPAEASLSIQPTKLHLNIQVWDHGKPSRCRG
jgi:hypothetical protein